MKMLTYVKLIFGIVIVGAVVMATLNQNNTMVWIIRLVLIVLCGILILGIYGDVFEE